METILGGRCTREFRQEAVKLVIEEGYHVVKQLKGYSWLHNACLLGQGIRGNMTRDG